MTAHALDASRGDEAPVPGCAARPHMRRAERKTQLTVRSTASAQPTRNPGQSRAGAAVEAGAATGCAPSRYEPSELTGASGAGAAGGGATDAGAGGGAVVGAGRSRVPG